MAKCGKSKLDSHICRNLHTTIRRFGKQVPVQISTVRTSIRLSRRRPNPIPVAYPVLQLTDWAECLFNFGGHFFLQGRSLDYANTFRDVLNDYWEKFHAAEPDFGLPRSQWREAIPLALHGDEGRGRLKQPVMVMAVQTILPLFEHKTNMKGYFVLFGNLYYCFLFFCDVFPVSIHLAWLPTLDLRPSPCTRLLFAVLPAPYTSATLNDLLRAWVTDLNNLAENGMSVFRTAINIFPFVGKIKCVDVDCWWLLQCLPSPGFVERSGSQIPVRRDWHQRRLAFPKVSMWPCKWFQLQWQVP